MGTISDLVTALQAAGLPVAPYSGIEINTYEVERGILPIIFGYRYYNATHCFESELELYAFLRGLKVGVETGGKLAIQRVTRSQGFLPQNQWLHSKRQRGKSLRECVYSWIGYLLHFLIPSSVRFKLMDRSNRKRRKYRLDVASQAV